MLSKLTLSFLLTVSLSCFGQVVSTGGYATTAGPSATPVSAANAPLVATPDIALPGSGPAHGSPLGSSNTNDSRFSTGPSVYNPNSIPGIVSAETTAENTAPATQSAPAANAASANEPFEFGVQQVVTEAPAPNAPVPSLGEIARNYREHPVHPTKMINNDTVARLNANPKEMGNIIPAQENTTVAAGTTPTAPSALPADANLMARNQAPALPQSDQSEATEQPQAHAQPSATAAQQKTASTNPASSQTAPAQSSGNDAAPATTSSNGQADTGATLPQTASHLPLLLLFGGLGVVGGALYLIRR